MIAALIFGILLALILTYFGIRYACGIARKKLKTSILADVVAEQARRDAEAAAERGEGTNGLHVASPGGGQNQDQNEKRNEHVQSQEVRDFEGQVHGNNGQKISPISSPVNVVIPQLPGRRTPVEVETRNVENGRRVSEIGQSFVPQPTVPEAVYTRNDSEMTIDRYGILEMGMGERKPEVVAKRDSGRDWGEGMIVVGAGDKIDRVGVGTVNGLGGLNGHGNGKGFVGPVPSELRDGVGVRVEGNG